MPKLFRFLRSLGTFQRPRKVTNDSYRADLLVPFGFALPESGNGLLLFIVTPSLPKQYSLLLYPILNPPIDSLRIFLDFIQFLLHKLSDRGSTLAPFLILIATLLPVARN